MGDRVMEIILPAEMAHYEGELRYFFDSMVRKLYVNRHRGFGEGVTFKEALAGIDAEVDELSSAVLDGEAQFAAYFEAIDIAAWSFIAALVLSRMTKDQYKELKVDNERQTA